jgi:hypothetical protein
MRDYQSDTFAGYYPASRQEVLFFSQKGFDHQPLFLSPETPIQRSSPRNDVRNEKGLHRCKP